MSSLATNGSTPVDGKYAVAKRLADAHRATEPEIGRIYLIEAPGRENDPAEPVKLLEINPNTPASGILPVGFSAHPQSGIFYPIIIVEIHPSEMTQLEQGQLVLPNGWQFDPAKPI